MQRTLHLIRQRFGLLLAGLLVCAMATPAWADPVEEAKRLFEQYIELEKNGDPSLMNLYSETASIKIYKAHKDGSRIRESVPLEQYKEMLRSKLAASQHYVYSEISYSIFENTVKIKAKRIKPNAGKKDEAYSHLMTVEPAGEAGDWCITKETATVEAE